MIFRIRGKTRSTPFPSVTVPDTSTVFFYPAWVPSSAVIVTVPTLLGLARRNREPPVVAERTKPFPTSQTPHARVADATFARPAAETCSEETIRNAIDVTPRRIRSTARSTSP